MLCGVLVIACRGGASGPGPAAVAPIAAPPDPAAAFRKSYVNPGGMWLPQQMLQPEHVEALRHLGLRLDPRSLADPRAAPLNGIVWIGGCTGAFVSPDGLIVTARHCVEHVLQANTDRRAGRDLLEDGFLAKTRAEELATGPMPVALVALAFKDVTNEVRDGLAKIGDPAAREREGARRLVRLNGACSRSGMSCTIRPYFGGAWYLQTQSLMLRDVRLVYVPPRSVGDYGGESSNWRWPRYAGDWAFYRAYVGKNGAPADYSPQNEPLHPRNYLQVTTTGVEPGDFVMAAGYPGYTSRTTTAADLHHEVEWRLPYVIALARQRYAIVAAHAADAAETGTKAIVRRTAIQNTIAQDEGALAGLTRGDLLARKDALEQKVRDWAAQPGREAHKLAIDKLEQLDAEHRRTARVDFDRSAVFRSSALLEAALSLTRWCEERAKSDAERRPGYQGDYLRGAVRYQRQLRWSYDRTLDRAMLRLALVHALQLPEADRPWLATLLGVGQDAPIDEAVIDRTLDAWYRVQQIEGEEFRVWLLTKGTTGQLRASKDSFLQAVQRIWPVIEAQQQAFDAFVGDRMLLTPFYVSALRAVSGDELAPDANGSLRITYGTIRSLRPESADPADRPFSMASQILSVDTGKPPFDAPPRLLAAVKARRFGAYADPALGGDLPVTFLSDLDIAGGNSGSPTLNARGELVGLLFDGIVEGAASGAMYDPATTRAISVDVRYMLWTMELLDGGDRLIEEMGLRRTLR